MQQTKHSVFRLVAGRYQDLSPRPAVTSGSSSISEGSARGSSGSDTAGSSSARSHRQRLARSAKHNSKSPKLCAVKPKVNFAESLGTLWHASAKAHSPRALHSQTWADPKACHNSPLRAACHLTARCLTSHSPLRAAYSPTHRHRIACDMRQTAAAAVSKAVPSFGVQHHRLHMQDGSGRLHSHPETYHSDHAVHSRAKEQKDNFAEAKWQHYLSRARARQASQQAKPSMVG